MKKKLFSFGSCPRPLSRKKLRQLMPLNHRALAAGELARKYGRSPGRGRTRCRMDRQLDELEKQSHLVGAKKMESGASILLKCLRILLGRGVRKTPRRPARTVTAKKSSRG